MKNSGIPFLFIALILISSKVFEMLILPYLPAVRSSLGASQKPRARPPNKLSMPETGVDPHGWECLGLGATGRHSFSDCTIDT